MIAVVQGGHDSEAEISRVTSKAFQEALEKLGKEFQVLEFDKSFVPELEKLKPELCINALHGTLGEDGVFQGICEFLSVPYTGSGVFSSALSFDKSKSNLWAQKIGVSVLPFFILKRGERLSAAQVKEVNDWKEGFVVKPVASGSSRGVTLCDHLNELEDSLDEALKWDSRAMVEKRVQGIEVTASVLRGQSLDLIEIKPKKGFYDLKNKYTDGATEYILPAKISDKLTEKIKSSAEEVFEVFDLKTYGRVDFLVDEEKQQEYFLEVNTLPGFTPTSLFPKAAAARGIAFSELVEFLIQDALNQ